MWTSVKTMDVAVTGPVAATELVPPFSVDTLLKVLTYFSMPAPSQQASAGSALVVSYTDPSGNATTRSLAGVNTAYAGNPLSLADEWIGLVGANQTIDYAVQAQQGNTFLAGYTLRLVIESMPA